MYRAKHSILALLMMAIFMTSCNDNLMDIESDIISTNSLEPMTRSMSDSICEEDATILEETDELKILKEISDQLKSSKRNAVAATTDDFFYSNIFAINDNESSTVFNQKANSIKQEKQAFFDLEIGANSVKRLNPQMGNPLCIDLRQVDESSMAVYTNPRTGVQYIYDKAKRIAFSHIIDDIDEDWILDEYGIRDWVESLPKKSISMATLASYTIIGL